MGYLQRFPFDKVKIDRAFVAPLGAGRARAWRSWTAVVGLCNGLDMETTAEGVETEEQLTFLTRIGCIEVQGYYFSPPRPAGEIAALIAQLGIERRDTGRNVDAPMIETPLPIDGGTGMMEWVSRLEQPVA